MKEKMRKGRGKLGGKGRQSENVEEEIAER